MDFLMAAENYDIRIKLISRTLQLIADVAAASDFKVKCTAGFLQSLFGPLNPLLQTLQKGIFKSLDHVLGQLIVIGCRTQFGNGLSQNSTHLLFAQLFNMDLLYIRSPLKRCRPIQRRGHRRSALLPQIIGQEEPES